MYRLLLLIGVLYTLVMMVIPMRHNRKSRVRKIFLFHPSAHAGGGGEKCVWALIFALVSRFEIRKENGRTSKPLCINLLADRSVPHVRTLLAQVNESFGIEFPYISAEGSPVVESRNITRLSKDVTLKLIRLDSASLLFKQYPVLTQILQLLAGVVVGTEAAFKTTGNRLDQIWDTVGVHSTIFCFSWLTCQFRRKSYCYIHWPFVATEAPPASSALRQVYHFALRKTYSLLQLSFRNPIVVNSTYTLTRMKKHWPGRVIQKVYPPIHKLPADQFIKATEKKNWVISVAQMRPEKNHQLQIQAICYLVDKYEIPKDTRVMICGSMPPQGDHAYFTYVMRLAEESLKDKHVSLLVVDHSQPTTSSKREQHILSCSKEEIKASIEFHLNLPISELHNLLKHAKVGLHTMVNEHFGLAVVETTMWGAYMIGHDSGGPRDDILVPPSSSELQEWDVKKDLSDALWAVATTPEQFAKEIKKGLMMKTSDDLLKARTLAMTRRFPDALEFGTDLLVSWGQRKFMSLKID